MPIETVLLGNLVAPVDTGGMDDKPTVEDIRRVFGVDEPTLPLILEKAEEACITARQDIQTLDDLDRRYQLGEDVYTLGMLRGMLNIAGREYTMKEMRRILNIPDPKPTVWQLLKSIGALAIISAFPWAYLQNWFASTDANTRGWGTYVLLAFMLWATYTFGKSMGAKLYP